MYCRYTPCISGCTGEQRFTAKVGALTVCVQSPHIDSAVVMANGESIHVSEYVHDCLLVILPGDL